MRTGASLVFDLDVTQIMSACANVGCRKAVVTEVSFHPLKRFKHEPGMETERSMLAAEGISGVQRVLFTIFCVDPLVRVYLLRRSLTSMSLM